MQQNDIVIVNVVGTNGSTRNQKTVTRRFNGAGQPLNDDGQVSGASAEALRNLPSGETQKAPDFPMPEYLAAQNKGAAGAEEVQQILIAHAERTEAWKKSIGGGNEDLQIVKSVIEYTKEFHNFKEQDGNWFVIKPENLAVTKQTLPDKRTLFTVAGTAVFG
jgi:hypothetical protein